jgi:hypothetical protein
VNFFILFLNLLYSFGLKLGDEDKFCWVLSIRGLLDVRSYNNVLIPHNDNLFPWGSIWWKKVSFVVVFFSWSAALGKILTMDNLRKHHVIVLIVVVCVRRVGNQ